MTISQNGPMTNAGGQGQTLGATLAQSVLDPDTNMAFQVFDILRDLIVSVKLVPGQRVSEKEIASALQASKTPVREALIRLDEINLVKIVPQSGTYVTRISVNRYTTACFIRLNLELGAIRMAIQSPDPRHYVGELDGILDQQTTALQAQDLDRFFELDDAFHRHLFVLAGQLDVWKVARRSQFDLNRVRLIRRKNRITRGADVLQDHRDIVDAIRAGVIDQAEDRLRRHIGDVHQQTGILFNDVTLRGLIELPQV